MGIFSRRKKALKQTPEKPAHSETQSCALSILKQTGFDPDVVVDVGANKGQWTRGCRALFPDARYFLFEPQTELRKEMSDLEQVENVLIKSMGLGSEPGVHAFTLHERDDSCSFAFSEAEAESRNFRQIELEIDTLDRLIANGVLPAPDILKIDVEGWDLEVLAGSEGTLPSVDVVFVEACVCKKRTPNDLLTVLQYMDERGFSLVDFSDLNRPHQFKLLWLVEAMFIRRDCPTYKQIENYRPG